MNSRKVQKTGIVARWGNTDGNNPPVCNSGGNKEEEQPLPAWAERTGSIYLKHGNNIHGSLTKVASFAIKST